jgi:hypothetical protein
MRSQALLDDMECCLEILLGQIHRDYVRLFLVVPDPAKWKVQSAKRPRESLVMASAMPRDKGHSIGERVELGTAACLWIKRHGADLHRGILLMGEIDGKFRWGEIDTRGVIDERSHRNHLKHGETRRDRHSERAVFRTTFSEANKFARR